jgi:predicted PolB exonuclease-like 3'-5' exonuclease
MPSWPVLVFDIETIPDIAGLRLLRDADPAASDEAVLAAEVAERAAAGKSDFLPLHLQRVLVVSCAFRNAESLRVHSFVDRESGGASGEGRVIQAFFASVEKHAPQLVSWNGGGFDLPVLHYRGLRHGVTADRYWCLGEGGAADDREFKYNNYINRYHMRHMDLMDVLAMYQPRASAPLDAMAKLCGFPGKLGMDGSHVYSAFLDGKLEEIRQYCDATTPWRSPR